MTFHDFDFQRLEVLENPDPGTTAAWAGFGAVLAVQVVIVYFVVIAWKQTNAAYAERVGGGKKGQ